MAFILDSFRKHHEEPEFEVLEEKDDYEVRMYQPGSWVQSETDSYNDGKAFNRLFKYISGENEPKTKLQMTVPVTHLVDLSDKEKHQFRYMAFYVPKKHHVESPKPKCKEVVVKKDKEALKYAVRKFAGYPRDPGWKREVDILEKALERDGVVRAADYSVYFCQYQAPWILFGRRNEVWIPIV